MEWKAFVESVHREYGEDGRYVSREIERAMREWADLDDLAPIEEKVNRLVRAAGRTPEENPEKKIISTCLEDEDTTRVSHRVDSQLKNDFAEYVNQTSEERLGLALGRALRQCRMEDRSQRLLNKLNRVVEDAEDLLAEMPDGGELSTRQKRTITICDQLGDQFTESDLKNTIRKVAGDSPPTIRDYTQMVLDRRNVVKHPYNPDLYIPESEAREQGFDPNAPAIDRKEYGELTREEKVRGLQIELARRSLSNNGKYQVDAQEVKRGIFDREPSDSHSRELLRFADEEQGFHLVNRRGKLRLRINIDDVTNKTILKPVYSEGNSDSLLADEKRSLEETVPATNSGQETGAD